MQHYDIIIIGSGLGGLLCGYILSKEGLRVGILEKHSIPGGNLQSFTRHGYHFDTGVHYIGCMGKGQILDRYWRYFGLTDQLLLQPLDQDGFDRIGFGDLEFPLAQGFDHFVEQLLPCFPQAKASLTAYTCKLKEIAEAFPLYNLELPENHHESGYISQSAARFLTNLLGNYREKSAGIPLSSIVAGNNFLYAGHPFTPLYIAGLISHSFISGACRIIGGSNQIAEQLVKSIENQGGAVFTNKEVIKISRSAGNFILTTSGNELFEGSKLISAIHPAVTLDMFPDSMIRPAFQKRISGLPNTPSSFILYIGTKPDSFPYLNYNFYGHVNQDVWQDGATTGPQWPSMYMLSTPCHKPDQKFAKTITIITYMHPGEVNAWKDTPSGYRGKEYQSFKKEKTQKLLTLVGKKFPGLESSIDWMDAATPLTYRDYTGIPDGALYGIRKDYTDPLMTTIFPKTKIPGFLFTGQNTNLHGVLGVTIGAVITCGEILGLPYLLKKIKHES